MLGLVSTAARAIGAKVAADHVAVVEVSIDGVVTRASSTPFDPSSTMAIPELAGVLRSFVDAGTDAAVLGIGVAIPGTVDQQGEGVVDSIVLDWSQVPLGAALRHSLRMPVLVENNVNALSIAERIFGRGRDHQDFVIVTIGSGVGAGIITEGAILRGHAGGAGEIGHIPIGDGGLVCRCGNRGCLETHIGEAAIVVSARSQGIIAGKEGIIELTRRADSGDNAARAIFQTAGSLLGRAVAGLVNTLDPEIVVISGEGVTAWEHWAAGFQPAIVSALLPSRRNIAVSVESWLDDRWAQGAACLVLATPFDTAGIAGDQGELVRARLREPLSSLSSR
jgi:predicted NBD/HSP70 family sugar kinase